MADVGQFLKAVREVANVRQIPPEKLIGYEQYFDPRAQIYEQQCQAQLQVVRSEIERRSLAEESKLRHQEVLGIGKKTLESSKKTLSWARIAAWAGIAAVPVGIASLVYQIYFSKVPPATSEQASPNSSLQIPTPTSVPPAPEASSSSATPSPEQAATVMPLP